MEEEPLSPSLLPDVAEAEPFPSGLLPSRVVPVEEEVLGVGVLVRVLERAVEEGPELFDSDPVVRDVFPLVLCSLASFFELASLMGRPDERGGAGLFFGFSFVLVRVSACFFFGFSWVLVRGSVSSGPFCELGVGVLVLELLVRLALGVSFEEVFFDDACSLDGVREESEPDPGPLVVFLSPLSV